MWCIAVASNPWQGRWMQKEKIQKTEPVSKTGEISVNETPKEMQISEWGWKDKFTIWKSTELDRTVAPERTRRTKNLPCGWEDPRAAMFFAWNQRFGQSPLPEWEVEQEQITNNDKTKQSQLKLFRGLTLQKDKALS